MGPDSCSGLWLMSAAKLAVAPLWHWPHVCTRLSSPRGGLLKATVDAATSLPESVAWPPLRAPFASPRTDQPWQLVQVGPATALSAPSHLAWPEARNDSTESEWQPAQAR